MRKEIILFTLLLCAAALAAGCSEAASAPATVQVRVSYDGDWSGSYGDVGGQSSIDGSGSRTIEFPAESIVSVAFQKKGGDSKPLTVEIIKDGTVLKSGSTTAAYGVVSVSTTL